MLALKDFFPTALELCASHWSSPFNLQQYGLSAMMNPPLFLSLLCNFHIFCFPSKVIVSLVFTCLLDAEGSFGTLTTDFPTASASAHFSALTQSLYQQSAHRASPTQGRPPHKGEGTPVIIRLLRWSCACGSPIPASPEVPTVSTWEHGTGKAGGPALRDVVRRYEGSRPACNLSILSRDRKYDLPPKKIASLH